MHFLSRIARQTRLFRLSTLPARIALFAILIPTAALAMMQLRYDREYPVMGYSSGTPSGPVAQLGERIENGEVKLEFDDQNGYLASVLDALDIDVASQMLVFSKTSVQKGRISPETPRALYFRDDVYVGWVQGSASLEISTLDPDLGPVFYTLSQQDLERPQFERQTFRCLRCHDSYSMTGGGVPRYIMGSMFPDANGLAVSHEGWYLTTDRSPINQRWGGWYVTGTHGEQKHMGNLIVTDPTDREQFNLDRGANITDLDGLVDTSPYLSKHSDIVALMVIEHQVGIQNLIIAANWKLRSALAAEDQESDSVRKLVEEVTEPLVEAMLFVGEAPLTGPIAGTSGFTSNFVSRGRRDGEGRSLQELDLNNRLFRYPLSYLVYSEAFDALPEVARDYVYRRLSEILGGEDQSDEFAHLDDTDRLSISEILEATKAEFADYERR